ncbi:efflux RND transporter periplasmic adaptor subunit [Rubripirellula sp.]|jgi:HlyD family secretion protein|nr:efflux RND transporter periplasmic adaptor subunit [Planctomycetaceae bacterium]MDA9858118.1 efflux RND transporter periplasmic adaptor subunit [Rubripirellula sp.]MDF1840038.1 efflux RND transporter periplasmic adaptor subunit [Rubripirellula sp.]
MRLLIRLVIVLIILSGLTAAGYQGRKAWEKRNRPEFRFAEITTGDIQSVVNSTGEVKPVLSISVGSFVSGPIQELHVDFNDTVKVGQLMAEIDPRLFEASVKSDQATLAIRKGEVQRVGAELKRAEADEKRANSLRERGAGFISQVEIDQVKYARQALEAQLLVAEAGVAQAEASLENSQANLDYTRIVSPVDGIVIDRKIEPGQTLAAQFQTPELFTVAPDIRREMHIFASVDEADIGMIRDAADAEKRVEFTVDAHPDLLFEGSIKQIRLSPVVLQNVVTYPVVVSAPNPDQKLMPGMTADLSFQIEERKDCQRLPNAALRYFPEVELVREQDKYLITGITEDELDQPDQESAAEKTSAAEKRTQRYVWVWEEPTLRAIPVTIGIRDSKWTELVSGDVKVGDRLVTAKK